MDRAQTTLDFLVGTTVFLLTVSAVLITIPGLSDPFVAGTESSTITADRAAESLVSDLLVHETAQPHVYQGEAVSAFFALTPGAAKTELGIDTTVNMNVTIANDTGQLHALGQDPGDTDVSVAWRTGLLEGERVELVVKVW